MKTFVPEPVLNNVNDLLKALEELNKVHICDFKILRCNGKDGTPTWKCDCGKTVKSN